VAGAFILFFVCLFFVVGHLPPATARLLGVREKILKHKERLTIQQENGISYWI
jgi:hypothetical protein